MNATPVITASAPGIEVPNSRPRTIACSAKMLSQPVDQPHPAGQLRVEHRAGDDDDARQDPAAPVVQALGEVVRRGDAAPREQHEHHQDPEVRRVHVVPQLAAHRGAQDPLGGHRQGDREDHHPDPVVDVDQHVQRDAGDVRREQELDQALEPAAEVARCAPLDAGADRLQHELGGVAGGDGDERPDPRLLEPEDDVPDDVEDRDRDGEPAQRDDDLRVVPRGAAGGRVPAGLRFLHGHVPAHLSLADSPSTSACRPWLSSRSCWWTAPWRSRHCRCTWTGPCGVAESDVHLAAALAGVAAAAVDAVDVLLAVRGGHGDLGAGGRRARRGGAARRRRLLVGQRQVEEAARVGRLVVVEDRLAVLPGHREVEPAVAVGVAGGDAAGRDRHGQAELAGPGRCSGRPRP